LSARYRQTDLLQFPQECFALKCPKQKSNMLARDRLLLLHKSMLWRIKGAERFLKEPQTPPRVIRRNNPETPISDRQLIVFPLRFCQCDARTCKQRVQRGIANLYQIDFLRLLLPRKNSRAVAEMKAQPIPHWERRR
jgi:hypothetical protein